MKSYYALFPYPPLISFLHNEISQEKFSRTNPSRLKCSYAHERKRVRKYNSAPSVSSHAKPQGTKTPARHNRLAFFPSLLRPLSCVLSFGLLLSSFFRRRELDSGQKIMAQTRRPLRGEEEGRKGDKRFFFAFPRALQRQKEKRGKRRSR